MTFCAITTTADRRRVVLSMDRRVSFLNGSARGVEATWAASYDAQLEATYMPLGERGPRPLWALGSIRKVIRRGDIVLGGIGDAFAVARWYALLGRAETLGHAQALAALYFDRFPPRRPAHLFLVGAEDGEARAYSYSTPTGEPRLLEPGHVLHPPPDPEGARYDDILRAWEPAVFQGIGIVRFHELVYESALEALKARRFRLPTGFGGELRTEAVVAPLGASRTGA